MNLWWLVLPAGKCSFNELTTRECLAFGWSEMGSIEKYIKKSGPGKERLFKCFIQVLGDGAYLGTGRGNEWSEERAFDGVPAIFSSMLEIKEGDFVAVIEVGNELSYGRPMLRGITRINADAKDTYVYDDDYQYAHSICSGTQWFEWNRVKSGELPMPDIEMKILNKDNSSIDIVEKAWMQYTSE